jgi:hypothetical protein
MPDHNPRRARTAATPDIKDKKKEKQRLRREAKKISGDPVIEYKGHVDSFGRKVKLCILCNLTSDSSSPFTDASPIDCWKGSRPWRFKQPRLVHDVEHGIVSMQDPVGKCCGICYNVYRVMGVGLRAPTAARRAHTADRRPSSTDRRSPPVADHRAPIAEDRRSPPAVCTVSTGTRPPGGRTRLVPKAWILSTTMSATTWSGSQRTRRGTMPSTSAILNWLRWLLRCAVSCIVSTCLLAYCAYIST